LRDLDRLVWHQETPAPTASLYSQWEVMRAAGRTLKVLLDGQGADELLGGYTGYFPTYLRAVWRDVAREHDVAGGVYAALAYPFLSFIAGEPLLWQAVRGSVPGRLRNLATGMAVRLGRADPAEPRLLASGFASPDDRELAWPRVPEVTGDPFLDLLRHQFFQVGLPTLLQLEDRNSMAFSVESRLPFTDDHRLVEFGMGLPRAWRVRGYSTKHILREAMRGTLVESVRRRRRKLGFPTPLAAWLRREPHLLEVWRQIDFGSRGILSADAVQTLVAEHRAGVADRSGPLFRALSLEMWCRVFLDGAGRKPAGSSLELPERRGRGHR